MTADSQMARMYAGIGQSSPFAEYLRVLAFAIVTDVEPLAAMTVQDATELASLRRGAEPLRLLVMPQRDPTVVTARVIEAMPVLIG
jgi:hypothetical protein